MKINKLKKIDKDSEKSKRYNIVKNIKNFLVVILWFTPLIAQEMDNKIEQNNSWQNSKEQKLISKLDKKQLAKDLEAEFDSFMWDLTEKQSQDSIKTVLQEQIIASKEQIIASKEQNIASKEQKLIIWEKADDKLNIYLQELADIKKSLDIWEDILNNILKLDEINLFLEQNKTILSSKDVSKNGYIVAKSWLKENINSFNYTEKIIPNIIDNEKDLINFAKVILKINKINLFDDKTKKDITAKWIDTIYVNNLKESQKINDILNEINEYKDTYASK